MEKHKNPQDQRDDILYLLGQVDTNVKFLLVSRDNQETRIVGLERFKTQVLMVHTALVGAVPLVAWYIPDFIKHVVKGYG